MLRDAIDTFRGLCHFSLNYDVNNTVILSGVARGGTTWIAEALNCQNHFRYMFEPFQTKYVPLFKDFILNQYISPTTSNPDLVNRIHTLLSGKIHNPWIDQFNKKIIYNRILIKAVRMNLLLGFVKQLYPNMKIILLMRHPFAVANSRAKLGWNGYVQSFLNQKELKNDYLSPYADRIDKCTTDFEKQVCMWCIQNFVPMNQLSTDKNMYVCFYELFCKDVEKEVKKIFSWMGITIDSLNVKQLNQLSKMAKKQKTDSLDFLEAWKANTSKDKIRRGLEILNWFGLDRIYGESAMPIAKNYGEFL